jgi:hypothetical protein
MGYGSYSLDDRSKRAFNVGYSTKSVNEIFTQNVEMKMHESMNPNGILKRECCDSETHPNATPVQLYLDVTGSMGHIPHEMIKEGLPTLMGTLIQNGVKDASLMFGAIGDHECDKCPLQVGQFESGDAELDMWLTRTYLEGCGGGNAGESYLLAWYFAANHVRTDAFDKRKKKGFVFTVGDEPCLRNLPVSAVKDIMGNTAIGQSNYTREELLAAARVQNHVYHIHVKHDGRYLDPHWKEMLDKNLIELSDYKTLSRVISDIILSHKENAILDQEYTIPADKKGKPEDHETEQML